MAPSYGIFTWAELHGGVALREAAAYD